MKPNRSQQEMLQKLDSMYDKEEHLKKEIIKLKIEYEQLQEDKELLQTMIMYSSNRNIRKEEFMKGKRDFAADDIEVDFIKKKTQ